MTENIADRMGKISPFYVMELMRRAKELEAQGRNIVHMEIGEPDFPTPRAIIDAGVEYVKKGQVKYTPAAGLDPLREKIVEYYRKRYQVTVDKKRIFVTPGASGAFLLTMGVMLNPHMEVMMADPCYPCNSNFIALFDGVTRLVPVDSTTGYQIDAGLIRRHWNEKTSGVLIASPSNPTGAVMKEGMFREAVNATESLGGHFISDEIYHGLEYGELSATAIKYDENAFVINSFSKFFGMTGWRVGWLVAPEYCIDAVEKLAQNIFISTPAHSQFAAMAAFDEDNLAELERRRREFKARRDFLFEKLVNMGFGVPFKPEGAFYIYADSGKIADDSFRFARDLLEVEGVAVTPGKDFGRNRANSFVRFAYTTSLERIEEGVFRLERFVKRG
ncbi:MAG: aminotransferase class I/II-fold pyridoxal phosphate-dependent enzyme [Gammaproteobacteria bacterium]